MLSEKKNIYYCLEYESTIIAFLVNNVVTMQQVIKLFHDKALIDL